MTKVIYTTASADYDWSFTREINCDVGRSNNGKTIRKVEISAENERNLASRVDDQCGRYASGLHMAVGDDAEWQKLVGYKLVTLT